MASRDRTVVAAAVAAALLQSAPALAQRFTSQTTPLTVETVASGLNHPWGFAFLPDGGILVTERPGRMRVVATDGKVSPAIAGVPPVFGEGCREVDRRRGLPDPAFLVDHGDDARGPMGGQRLGFGELTQWATRRAHHRVVEVEFRAFQSCRTLFAAHVSVHTFDDGDVLPLDSQRRSFFSPRLQGPTRYSTELDIPRMVSLTL